MLIRQAVLDDAIPLSHLMIAFHAEAQGMRPGQYETYLRSVREFLQRGGFDRTFDPWVENDSNRPSFTLVAEEKGELCGQVDFMICPFPGGPEFLNLEVNPCEFWASIIQLYVKPDYRRRGIGSALLEDVVTFANGIGIRVVSRRPEMASVDVRRDELKGIAEKILYYAEALGYRHGIYGPGHDEAMTREWRRILSRLDDPHVDLRSKIRRELKEVARGAMREEVVTSCVDSLVRRCPVYSVQHSGSGIRLVEAECAPELVPFYERCGFRSIFQAKDEGCNHTMLRIVQQE